MTCAVCGHDRDNHPDDAACTECHCSEFQLEHPQGKPPLEERFDEEKWANPQHPLSPAEAEEIKNATQQGTKQPE